MLDALGAPGLCARIIEGESLSAIARSLDVGVSTLTEWIALEPERARRAHEARIASSEAYAHKAEEALAQASNAFEVSRARELAHHYRWLASKRNPAGFGERVELAGTLGVNELTDDQLDARIAKLAAALGVVGAGQGAAAAPAAGEAAPAGTALDRDAVPR